MDSSSISPLAFVAAGAGSLQLIWLLFDRGQQVASPDTRAKVAKALRTPRLGPRLAASADAFVDLFDAVFGRYHLTWRCFLASALATIASLLITTCFSISVMSNSGLDLRLIGLLLVASLPLNVIPDYLSLLETRAVLRWVTRPRSVPFAVVILAFDVLCSLTIWLAWFILFTWLKPFGARFDLGESLRVVPDLLALKGVWGKMGIFLYSSLFTSVWAWLFMISVALAQVGGLTDRSVVALGVILNFEDEPIRSLGYIALVIAVIAITAIGIVVLRH